MKWWHWGLIGAGVLLFMGHKEIIKIIKKSGLVSKKRKYPVSGIIFHWSVTASAASTFNVLKNKECSTHYEVDKDGTVTEYLNPQTDVAWHTATPGFNDRFIGIDLTGQKGEFTQKQLDVAAQLAKKLAKEYKFPLNLAEAGFNPNIKPDSYKGILSHANVQATKQDLDAGTWSELKKRIV